MEKGYGIEEKAKVLEVIELCRQEGRTAVLISYLGDSLHGQREVFSLDEEGEVARPWLQLVLDRMLKSNVPARVIQRAELEKGGFEISQFGFESLIVEVIRPRRSLVIFGAGHVGQALAILGSMVGFQVTILDDRREFLTEHRLPGSAIQRIVEDFEASFDQIEFSSNSAVVIVTRGHQHDEICLRRALEKPWAYLGMIGSRRRVKAIRDRLLARGAPADRLARLHAPVGLPIGAATPQEIAIAILAEIIQEFNCRKSEGGEHT